MRTLLDDGLHESFNDGRCGHTHRCVLSRGHTLSSSSDGGYRRRRCGWCDSGRTYGGRAPQRQRLLKVAAIFKQWHPDRNTRFEFQCRHQQPAVGRTTPRGAEGDRPNYATSLAHHHRDDAVKIGPLRELDGTCNIKIAIKIGVSANEKLLSLLNTPQHHCSRATAQTLSLQTSSETMRSSRTRGTSRTRSWTRGTLRIR